jgi:hypothetical protein
MELLARPFHLTRALADFLKILLSEHAKMLEAKGDEIEAKLQFAQSMWKHMSSTLSSIDGQKQDDIKKDVVMSKAVKSLRDATARLDKAACAVGTQYLVTTMTSLGEHLGDNPEKLISKLRVVFPTHTTPSLQTVIQTALGLCNVGREKLLLVSASPADLVTAVPTYMQIKSFDMDFMKSVDAKQLERIVAFTKEFEECFQTCHVSIKEKYNLLKALYDKYERPGSSMITDCSFTFMLGSSSCHTCLQQPCFFLSAQAHRACS